MTTTLVHVWVSPHHIEDFITASIENHNASIKEKGNLRFDILQDAHDPAKFLLYEAYESEETAAAHKNTKHYLKWKDTVADWMVKPREGNKHIMLAPQKK